MRIRFSHWLIAAVACTTFGVAPAFADDEEEQEEKPAEEKAQPQRPAPKAESSDEEGEESEEQKPAEPAKPAQPAKVAEAAPNPAASDAWQQAAWRAINGTADSIDRCTGRYSEEFPDRVGKVDVKIEIAADGRVVKADARTPLQASQNLQVCLRDVAKTWRFQPLGEGNKVNTSLMINVKKGAKFRLAKPGEKEEATPGEQKQQADEGFIRFNFVPGWKPD